MARLSLWILVLAISASNLAFDLRAAPVGSRLAAKVEGETRLANPTYVAWRHPLRTWLQRIGEGIALHKAARHVFSARYALTGLPLLILVYFIAAGRVRDSHLGLAIAIGAFGLFAKAALWEAVWLMADICTVF